MARLSAYLEAMSDIDPAAPTIGGTPRARTRPAAVAVPERWAKAGAAPEPQPVPFVPREEKGRPDPVRYGDWESKGIAIDF